MRNWGKQQTQNNVFRVIYKIFAFYVPLIKFLKFGGNPKEYKTIKVYNKLEDLIFSREVIKMIETLCNDSDTNESIIHLPGEEEIIAIIR